MVALTIACIADDPAHRGACERPLDKRRPHASVELRQLGMRPHQRAKRARRGRDDGALAAQLGN